MFERLLSFALLSLRLSPRHFLQSATLLLIGLSLGATAQGQTAHFSYSQSIAFSSGLNTPAGSALDRGGNVYIADSNNNRVLKETLQSDDSYTQGTIGTGVNVPTSVAVDGSGSVYITD